MSRLIDADALIADLEYDVELDARALDCLDNESRRDIIQFDKDCKQNAIDLLRKTPTVQPERIWHSCKTPPKHHKDVLVRGTEAIDNVTIYMVMQWDVDTWRPTDYAPSIIWEEWSEIYE